MDKRHIIEKKLLPVLFLASLLTLAGFLPIRCGALDGVVADVLCNAGADSVAVGEVRVTLWRGVSVLDLRVYKRISAAEEYSANIDRIGINCNLIRMAFEVMADPSILEPDRDHFREVYDDPLHFAGHMSEFGLSVRPLRHISMRGASVRVTKSVEKKNRNDRVEEAIVGASIKGISADLDIDGRRRKTIDGRITIAEAVVPSLAVVENFSVKLHSSDDKFELTDGSGSVFGGKLAAALSLDIDSSRILSGSLRITGMDLERFCDGTGFTPGRISGIVDLDASIEPGSPTVPAAIRASGSAQVTRVSVNDIAMQRVAAVNQVSKDLRMLMFNEVKAEFRLYESKVMFDEITAAGEIMKFSSVGWIDFDGNIHHDLEGEFAPHFVAGLPRLVRNSFEKTEDGGGRFKCRITGTFHKPRVSVDRSVYNRAIRNLFR